MLRICKTLPVADAFNYMRLEDQTYEIQNVS